MSLSQNSPLEQGCMVQIGNSSFYITHFRDGVQMRHAPEEWNRLFAGKISDFVQNLQQRNADFNPDEVSELEIDLRGGATYKTQANPGAAIAIPGNRVDRAALREFVRILRASPGVPIDRNTIEASFHQASSPLAATAPNACTSIALDFAAEAARHIDGNFITPRTLEKSILKGQKKYAQMLPHIRGEMARAGAAMQGEEILIDFAALDLNTYYPLLQRGDVTTVHLSENTAADFARVLERLRTAGDVPAIFGGITNGRGDSYGVVIYKNEAHNVKEIIYFDSHSRDVNGTSNACAKRFAAIEEAADFLARRNPYKAEGQNPDRNEITFTSFCFHYGLKELFEAQEAYAAGREDARLGEVYQTLLNENQRLGGIIAALCGEGVTPEARKQSGLAAIQANPQVLMTVPKERLLSFLDTIEEMRWGCNN